MNEAINILSTQIVAGGSTLALVGAALKLMYNALKEERSRITVLGDKYEVEFKRKDESHAKEREEWRREREYFKQEIVSLRKQVADLYARIYKFDSEEA